MRAGVFFIIRWPTNVYTTAHLVQKLGNGAMPFRRLTR